MKSITRNLIGPALDYAFSKASNPPGKCSWGWFELDAEGYLFDPLNEKRYSPSTDPAQAYEFLLQEGITTICSEKWDTDHGYLRVWAASIGPHAMDESFNHDQIDPTYLIGAADTVTGPTLLVAATRCWVVHKVGEEIDVPDELLKLATNHDTPQDVLAQSPSP
jgi:hypothetical protein